MMETAPIFRGSSIFFVLCLYDSAKAFLYVKCVAMQVEDRGHGKHKFCNALSYFLKIRRPGITVVALLLGTIHFLDVTTLNYCMMHC